MTGTMTWVGLDVHARSTHAAAIDSMTGELTRMRFGPGAEAPLVWLGELPGPYRGHIRSGAPAPDTRSAPLPDGNAELCRRSATYR